MSGDNLALSFQEILTAVVRLRSNRQSVTSAEGFRANVVENIKAANSAARRKGYSSENVKLAMFAVVGLLDESVLNSGKPVFEAWHKDPLAGQLFNTLAAGERVFDNINQLLARDDSQEVADLLEVYYLCLLLGFSGRYHTATAPELRSIKQALAQKIQRIRGAMGPLSPGAEPDQPVAALSGADPWTRRLLWAAPVSVVICLLFFAAFHYQLGRGLQLLSDLATHGI